MERVIKTIMISGILLIGLYACKTEKYITHGRTKPVKIHKIYENLEKQYLNYDQLTLKTSIKSYINSERWTLKCFINIQHDSLIYIIINHHTGLPFAKIAFTQDTVYYLNRRNNKYYIGSYDYPGKALQIDFSFETIQSILTNELFLYPDNDSLTYKKYFKAFADTGGVMLQANNRRRNSSRQNAYAVDDAVIYKVRINPAIFKIQHFSLFDLQRNREVDVEYKNFKKLKDIMFPENVDVILKSKRDSLELYMEYSDIEVNGDFGYSKFRLPKNAVPIIP